MENRRNQARSATSSAMVGGGRRIVDRWISTTVRARRSNTPNRSLVVRGHKFPLDLQKHVDVEGLVGNQLLQRGVLGLALLEYSCF